MLEDVIITGPYHNTRHIRLFEWIIQVLRNAPMGEKGSRIMLRPHTFDINFKLKYVTKGGGRVQKVLKMALRNGLMIPNNKGHSITQYIL